MAILNQFECNIVQRNKGIDAFLRKHYLGAPVAVKIQKETESLQEAVTLLDRAAQKKQCSFTILIRQNDESSQCSVNIPPNMIVINSNSLETKKKLAELLEKSNTNKIAQ